MPEEGRGFWFVRHKRAPGAWPGLACGERQGPSGNGQVTSLVLECEAFLLNILLFSPAILRSSSPFKWRNLSRHPCCARCVHRNSWARTVFLTWCPLKATPVSPAGPSPFCPSRAAWVLALRGPWPQDHWGQAVWLRGVPGPRAAPQFLERAGRKDRGPFEMGEED